LAAALLVASGPAFAQSAPFCLAGSGQPPQCLYADVASCNRDARPPETTCVAAPGLQLNFFGSGQFCTVDSQRLANCLYVDRTECDKEAGRSGTICVDRGLNHDAPSPFRYDPRLF
jgi:hypothetical protein